MQAPTELAYIVIFKPFKNILWVLLLFNMFIFRVVDYHHHSSKFTRPCAIWCLYMWGKMKEYVDLSQVCMTFFTWKKPQYVLKLSFTCHPGTVGWSVSPMYVVCLKSKCTDFLFNCLLDSPEITSYLLQSMTLWKLHNGSVFSTDHSSTGSHFL